MTNLWGGALPVQNAAKLPLEYFKEQGSVLTGMARGVLIGYASGSAVEGTIDADLQIRAPSLNNYALTVAQAVYPVGAPYPCKLIAPLTGSAFQVSSDHEFAAKLGEILSSDKVRTSVVTLLKSASATLD